MSFLAPWFLFGAFAVAAPVLFHLIRRSPQGRMPFSSLMFLSPSPPRLTRRSRLDHLLLLLLRATAFSLLVFAFARPFLREAAALDRGAGDRQRVLLLVDTSASMRRGDLWTKALAAADAALSEVRPNDEIAVYAFDRDTRPIVGFAELATLDPAQRKALATARFKELAPTWNATELGDALIDAVEAVHEGADRSEQSARGPRRIVLISDLQQGSRIEALTDFEWPRDVDLELKGVTASGGNASASLLADDDSVGDNASDLRVRVANDADANVENLQLQWIGNDDTPAGAPIAVYAPPGESRVVKAPRPTDAARQNRIRLLGDVQDFDNTLFVATQPVETVTVLLVGEERADDAEGLRYYAERALAEAPRQRVEVQSLTDADELPNLNARDTPLVLLTMEVNAEKQASLREYIELGGTVVWVLTSAGRHQILTALAGVQHEVESTEAQVSDYAMLGHLRFDHPLFAPLAGPQYNDFTKIRFWKYRRLAADALGDAQIVASFDGGDPAVIEKAIGKGRLVVLTSSWRPADSQWARSSKFVPFVQALLELSNPGLFEARSYFVGERVPIPTQESGAAEIEIRKPDGSVTTVASGSEFFTETGEPGVYAIDVAAGVQRFAVNLDPQESRTAPLPMEVLEQWGARLTSAEKRTQQVEQERQLRDVELEGRQKIWQWLIVAVLLALIAETWLAGRLSRPNLNQAEVLAT